MTDKQFLLQQFVQTFLLKDRRERSLVELTSPTKRGRFCDRLNHSWENVFDSRRLEVLSDADATYDRIRRLAGFKDDEECYVISHYDDCDDRFLPFGEAFRMIYGRGLASLLVSASGDRIFLETEQERGAATRFIGRI